MRRFPRIEQCALVLLLVVVGGCGRDDIQVYKVAKDQGTPPPASVQPSGMPPGHPEVPSASPQVQWKLPAGWQEMTPGEMRVASFKITGAGGKQADVGIFPLPGMAGRDLDNLNRWRGQVGLEPIAEAELPKAGQTVEIGNAAGQLYDLAGKNPGSGEGVRILAAILRREGTAWFFKMTGDDHLVAEQKPTFIEFLKSLSFPSATSMTELPPSHPPIGAGGAAVEPSTSASEGEGKPTWEVPPGWREVSAGQFLVAKFVVTGPNNAQAAVNVSMSAGTGGGVLANVNRWRGQLGLGSLSDSELATASKSIAVTGGQATLVDMAGTNARSGQKERLVGAIVPLSDRTWFYKLMGDAEVVQQQSDAFTKFLQSVKYAP